VRHHCSNSYFEEGSEATSNFRSRLSSPRRPTRSGGRVQAPKRREDDIDIREVIKSANEPSLFDLEFT
jgi:hypothetical protein